MALQEVDFESKPFFFLKIGLDSSLISSTATIKIIVVGNGCVGKTTMIHRFCTGEYTADYKKTLGVDFLEKEQYIPALGTNAKLMLWDTAGQEEFDTITRAYYRGLPRLTVKTKLTMGSLYNS